MTAQPPEKAVDHALHTRRLMQGKNESAMVLARAVHEGNTTVKALGVTDKQLRDAMKEDFKARLTRINTLAKCGPPEKFTGGQAYNGLLKDMLIAANFRPMLCVMPKDLRLTPTMLDELSEAFTLSNDSRKRAQLLRRVS